MDPKADAIPRSAAVLGGAGLLPFFFGLGAALFGRTALQQQVGIEVFLGYGAVILSFLGGVRWGAALVKPTWRALSLAVAPSLLAFGCLLLPHDLGLKFLAVGFLVVGLFDVTRGVHALWPEWYRRLRLRLSVAVVALHLMLLFGLHGRGWEGG